METQGETIDDAGKDGRQSGKAEGRAKVQALLWDRLDRAGMTRPRGQSVDDHAAMRARLCDRLAYMAACNLQTLAEVMIDHASGKRSPRSAMWSETAIRTYARALQTPPAHEFEIVNSWLASIEGPIAIDGGYAVELFRFLARRGVPPLAEDMFQIRRKADDNARQCELIRDRIRRSAADAADRGWLEQYERDRATVGDVVAAGAAKRARAAE